MGSVGWGKGVVSFWVKKDWRGEVDNKGIHTLRIKLQNVNMTIGIAGHDVQLLSIRQEIRIQHLHPSGALAEQHHLVRLLRVACEPNTLEGVGHQAEACTGQLLDTRDVAVHIHKRHGQERAVFLETAHHALLALGDKHQTLGADLGEGRDCTARDVLLGNQLQLLARLGLARFGDDVGDVEDVDAASGGEVFTLGESGADGDELLALVGRLGHFQVECLDAEDSLAWLHFDGVDHGPSDTAEKF